MSTRRVVRTSFEMSDKATVKYVRESARVAHSAHTTEFVEHAVALMLADQRARIVLLDIERALCELIIEQNDLAAERAIFATRLHKIDCAHRDVSVAMSARKRCECRDVAYLHHVREARFSTRVQDLKRMMTLNMITDDDLVVEISRDLESTNVSLIAATTRVRKMINDNDDHSRELRAIMTR